MYKVFYELTCDGIPAKYRRATTGNNESKKNNQTDGAIRRRGDAQRALHGMQSRVRGLHQGTRKRRPVPRGTRTQCKQSRKKVLGTKQGDSLHQRQTAEDLGRV